MDTRKGAAQFGAKHCYGMAGSPARALKWLHGANHLRHHFDAFFRDARGVLCQLGGSLVNLGVGLNAVAPFV